MKIFNKVKKENQTEDQMIVQKMVSKDANKVWEGSCAICSMSQNCEVMLKIVPYLSEIEKATLGMSDRFLRKAMDILYFYKTSNDCPCTILCEEMDPVKLEKNGYVKITEVLYYENSNQVNYYMIVCKACKKIYKVEERQYHYPWWEWIDTGLYSIVE